MEIEGSLVLFGEEFVLFLHEAHLLGKHLEFLLEVLDAVGLGGVGVEGLVEGAEGLLLVPEAHLHLLPVGGVVGIDLDPAAGVAGGGLGVVGRLLRGVAPLYLLVLLGQGVLAWLVGWLEYIPMFALLLFLI